MQVVGVQLDRRPQVGGERPFRVRRDQAQRPPGLRSAIEQPGFRAVALHLGGEKLAVRVAADLADVAGGDAQAGQAADGVGRRAAAGLLLVQAGDLFQYGVDLVDAHQGHAALGEIQGRQQPVVIDAHQDVDQGIAQTEYFFHGDSLRGACRALLEFRMGYLFDLVARAHGEDGGAQRIQLFLVEQRVGGDDDHVAGMDQAGGGAVDHDAP